MLWEIEIHPRHRDAERARVVEEFNLLTTAREGDVWIENTARGFLLEGNLTREQVTEQLMN